VISTAPAASNGIASGSAMAVLLAQTGAEPPLLPEPTGRDPEHPLVRTTVMRVSLGDASAVPASAAAPPAEAGVRRSPFAHADLSPFARVLHGIGRKLDRGEQLMTAAVDSMQAGGDFAPSRLIALQAGVYRYSEAIDLASRVVDRTTSAIKTVLQGNGQ